MLSGVSLLIQMRHRRVFVHGSLALAALMFQACGGEPPNPTVIVRDSLGTSIVEHSGLSDASVPQLLLEGTPSVRVGVTEGAEEYQFFRVSDALRRNDGSIIVLDRSRTMRAFDSLGAHLWTAGRSGQGPGEFAAAQLVVELRGDTLAVWDPGPGRLSLFTGEGTFVRAWTPPGLAASAVAVGPAGPDRLLVARRIVEPGVAAGRNALTSSSNLHLLDVTQRRDTILGRRLTAVEFQEVGEGGAYSPPIFGIPAVYGSTVSGFWYGTGETAELERVDESGARILLRWPGTGSVVEQADVDALVEKWGSAPTAKPELREYLARYANSHPKAERFPAYEEIRVDRSGNLWVREFVREHEDDGRRRWLVFSPDGQEILAKLEHSGALRLLRVDLGGVLGVERDEMGVERVVYRRVVR
jgi:hypothetical protein